jgi:hypothetical protein
MRVEYLTDTGVPLYIRSGEWVPPPVDWDNSDSFQKFLDSTIKLYFRQSGPGAIAPYNLFMMDMEDRNLKTGTIIVISHLFDNGITPFFSGTIGDGLNISGIINCSAMNQKERTGTRNFAAQVNENRESLYIVDGPMTIKEDLEKLL